MPTFLTFVDLAKNELRNAVVQNLASDPGSPVAGLVYYNTTSNELRYYDGTAWQAVGPAGAGGDHGTLTGLGDDDHVQYVLVDASRDFTGTPQVNGNVMWHAGNDGPGSTLDADTVDGVQAAALATIAYVDAQLDGLVDSAPGTLDTLNEIAAALGDDPNFAATITGLINAKPSKFAQDVGDGVATSIAVTHNLGSLDVQVEVFANADGATVYLGVTRTSSNVVTLNFGSTAPTTNQYRVVVTG